MTSRRGELPTVVVVDDDEDAAVLLRELLERRGYRALAAHSASECLAYVDCEDVNVVVTDIKMPGMSGVELCRELRARSPDVHVIVLSGSIEREHAASARHAGAREFIIKPVKIDLLERAIARAVEVGGGGCLTAVAAAEEGDV